MLQRVTFSCFVFVLVGGLQMVGAFEDLIDSGL